MAKKETSPVQDQIADIAFEFSGSSSRRAFARAAQAAADEYGPAAATGYQAAEFMGRHMQALTTQENPASPLKAYRLAKAAAQEEFGTFDTEAVDSVLMLHWAGAHDKAVRLLLAPSQPVLAQEAQAEGFSGRMPV